MAPKTHYCRHGYPVREVRTLCQMTQAKQDSILTTALNWLAVAVRK